MGDSMCSFNPIYGQGMTIAALEAVALQRHLGRHGRLQPRRFHRQLARLLRPPWQMATGADLVFPGVDGRCTRTQRLLAAYIVRLHAAAAHDPTVARSFVRVAGLVDPPQTLLRPPVRGGRSALSTLPPTPNRNHALVTAPMQAGSRGRSPRGRHRSITLTEHVGPCRRRGPTWRSSRPLLG